MRRSKEKSWRFEESKPGGGGIFARQVQDLGRSVLSSQRGKLLSQLMIRRPRFCSPLHNCYYGNGNHNGNGNCNGNGNYIFVSLFAYQLKGSLECSVNVEVFLAEKTESLPQLWLPRKEVESPTNPREGQKLKGISSTNNSHIISNSRVCWIIHNPKYKQREEEKYF